MSLNLCLLSAKQRCVCVCVFLAIESNFEFRELEFAMEDEELSSLVQAAEQLSSQLDDGSLGELPRVERNLRQIMEASNQLWIRASQTSGQETQGYISFNKISCCFPDLTCSPPPVAVAVTLTLKHTSHLPLSFSRGKYLYLTYHNLSWASHEHLPA